MKQEHIKHWNNYNQKASPRKKNSKEEARKELIRKKVDLVRDLQELGSEVSDVWEDL